MQQVSDETIVKQIRGQLQSDAIISNSRIITSLADIFNSEEFPPPCPQHARTVERSMILNTISCSLPASAGKNMMLTIYLLSMLGLAPVSDPCDIIHTALVWWLFYHLIVCAKVGPSCIIVA